jgi:hypothetical protein
VEEQKPGEDSPDTHFAQRKRWSEYAQRVPSAKAMIVLTLATTTLFHMLVVN